ncbi:glycoside hydrolase family 78 protein, partial [Cadophora sp. DSE1049]
FGIAIYKGLQAARRISLKGIYSSSTSTGYLKVSPYRAATLSDICIQVLDTSPKYNVTFSNIQVQAVSAIDPSLPVEKLEVQDHQLQAMDRVSMLTLRDCMQTVFEDGPRRDRRLWLGDLRLEALTNYFTFKHFDLVKRYLFLFAALPRGDGSLAATLFVFPKPQPAPDYITDYDALVEHTVYDYVVASAYLDTGRELWSTILGSMKGPLSNIDPNASRFDGSLTTAWKFCDGLPALDRDASIARPHDLYLQNTSMPSSLSSSPVNPPLSRMRS